MCGWGLEDTDDSECSEEDDYSELKETVAETRPLSALSRRRVRRCNSFLSTIEELEEDVCDE